MVTINISNRGIYTFVAVIVVALLAVGVYAYGTSAPSTFGHSADELEGVCKTDGTGCPTAIILEEPSVAFPSGGIGCNSNNEGEIMYFPLGFNDGTGSRIFGVYICANYGSGSNYAWHKIQTSA